MVVDEDVDAVEVLLVVVVAVVIAVVAVAGAGASAGGRPALLVDLRALEMVDTFRLLSAGGRLDFDDDEEDRREDVATEAFWEGMIAGFDCGN